MRNFCARLDARGLSDCGSFRQVAARYAFGEFRFIPPRDDRLNRFEGVFRPGRYELRVPVDRLRTGECGIGAELPLRFEGNCPPGRRAALRILLAHEIVLHLARGAADRYGPARVPGDLSLLEQMILASIVQKEAASGRDYDRVAAVFYNRLRKKMTLGSCPTVEYALGFHRPFLLFKDLELDSPYNVYKRVGLPPTPIAFFSDAALRAVRNPAAGDAVFFVFDWTTGELTFAEDYRDHIRNARRARENFKRKYGKKYMYRRFPDKYYESIDDAVETD